MQTHMGKLIDRQILLITLIAFGIYLPALSFGFVYDDALQIIHFHAVSGSEGSFADLWRHWLQATPPGNLFRPFVSLTYRINFLLSGLAPEAFHFTNNLLYCLTCGIAYLFIRPLVRSKQLAFLAILLFALHPTHVEVVANIIGRAEILALLFGLLSGLALSSAAHTAQRSTRFILFLLGCLCFFLAVTSKESALVLVLLIPAYVILVATRHPSPSKLSARFLLVSSGGLWLSAAVALLLRWRALGESFFIISDGKTIYSENPIFHLSFFKRLLPALKVLGDYVQQTLLPLHVSADYSKMPHYFMLEVYSLEGLLSFVTLGIFLAILYLNRWRHFAFWGIWFFVGFALTSNIVTTIGTVRGDRLLFLPGLGLITFIVCWLDNLTLQRKSGRVIFFALVTVALAMYSARTCKRIPTWANNQVLFTTTAIQSPLSPKSHYNLAVEHFQKQRYDHARKALNRSLELHPRYLFALRLMADVSFRTGDLDGLIGWYKKILEVKPDDEQVKLYLNKARQLKQKRLKSEANLP